MRIGRALIAFMILFNSISAHADFQRGIRKLVIGCAKILGAKLNPDSVDPDAAQEGPHPGAPDKIKAKNFAEWFKQFDGKRFDSKYNLSPSWNQSNMLSFSDRRAESFKDRTSRLAHALVVTWRASGNTTLRPKLDTGLPYTIFVGDLPKNGETVSFVDTVMDSELPLGVEVFQKLDPPLSDAERSTLITWLSSQDDMKDMFKQQGWNAEDALPPKTELPPVSNVSKAEIDIVNSAKTPRERLDAIQQIMAVEGLNHFQAWTEFKGYGDSRSLRREFESNGNVRRIEFVEKESALAYRTELRNDTDDFAKIIFSMLSISRKYADTNVEGPALLNNGNNWYVWKLPLNHRSVEFLSILSDPKLSSGIDALKNISPPLSAQELADIKAWFKQQEGRDGVASYNNVLLENVMPDIK